ncbi:two-component system sensor histidine kinase NtrB [Cereibacter sphaeroides]|uniref:two-component system sensor histidine kinase NtrB n=1 Tax=Cereibacter sphaeroides TaxID=1063 RepID=UPI003FCD9ED9
MEERTGRQAGARPSEPWALDPPADRGRVDLLSLMPLVAIVALVALVAASVWIAGRSETEQIRTKLATDALWVEQTLRFQLSVDEDMLARLGLDEAGGTAPAVLEARARAHIAANPEILSIVWHDAEGGIRRAVPGPADTRADEELAAQLRRAEARARPVYALMDGQTVTMGLRPQGSDEVITATVSLPLMLERHIPWWIAEQYAVWLLDGSDTVRARRSRGTPEPEGPSHSISFDPPLPGAVLRITSYEGAAPFARALLPAAIAGLAAFAILALLALYRNAQRRRAAELRLNEEMAFRRSMEESLTVGLRAKDHAGRVLYVNSAFCKLVGWNAEDLVGHDQPMPYWAPDRIEETLRRQRALAVGGAEPQAFETRFRRSDGSEIDVQVYEAPLIDAKGMHRGWMGSIIDITEARRAARLAREQEESLARTGRLVTLGEMASTLAHELNQPLAAIASYAAGAANLLRQERADPALLSSALAKLSHQADRAGQIIRRIQDLVRKREPRFSALDLATVVRETAGFLEADARVRGVRIAVDVAPAPLVLADRILLEQLLINLMRNGIEAMGEAGAVDALTVSLRPGPARAVIEVADRGPGIAPEVADRLFDAFTSTKAEGMGIGLNICRTIVEMHRGRLTHRPREGGGTVFRVALPAAAEEGVAAE